MNENDGMIDYWGSEEYYLQARSIKSFQEYKDYVCDE